MVDSVLANAAGGRRVRPENLHITLIFLGEADQPRAAGLHSAFLEAYRFAQTDVPPVFPMRLHCDHTGVFRQGRTGVLWLGVQPDPSLLRFHRLLKGILDREGLMSDDNHPLHPHITVARDVPFRRFPEDAGKQAGERKSDISGVILHVDGPSLMESIRDPKTGAVRYIPRCRPAEGPMWLGTP
jgi:2'-5' RNA ligase